MARQEQDSITRDGQPPVPGQPMPPGAMQGNRTGTSPNPGDQIKRGTPKMPQAGLPGSPSAGEPLTQNRGSPAAMNFNGTQMPPEMSAPAFFVKGPEGMVGPNGMRPPSSNPPGGYSGPQMNQPIPAPGNRMPGANWQAQQQGPQGQAMPPQQSPVNHQQPTGTQERAAMPPPQAPTAAGAGAGRASPQTGAAAPPTPQQANKPAPKKKETKDSRKVCLLTPSPTSLSFLIERDSSGLQRRQLLRLTRIPRPLPPPKQNLLQPRHLRPRLLLRIPTRSTKPPVTRQVPLSSQPLRLLRNRWCNSLTRTNQHSMTLTSLM